MNSSKQRNYYIDLLKLILAIIVALGHFGVELIINAGFAVSVFFMISGYYIAKHAYSKREDVCSYMRNRIRKVFPEYLISFLVLLFLKLAVSLIRENIDIINVVRYIINVIPEALLLQGLGFASETVNPTMWFMSVWMIASGFIYVIIKNMRKNILLPIMPFFIIFSFVIIGHQRDPWGLIGGVLYLPLFRGFVTMIIGVGIYFIEPIFIQIREEKKIVVFTVSIVMCFIIRNSNDCYLIFAASALLYIFTIHKTEIPNKYLKILSYCGIVSEKIYYWHYCFLIVLNTMFKTANITSKLISGGVYLTSIVSFAVICAYIQKNKSLFSRKF